MTELSVTVSNVGGIDDMTCTIDESMTIITGPNASNKTSLLKAIAFGLGQSTIPVKNDATEARVELEIDGERIVRTARATDNGIQIRGDSWLEAADDIELLERFGCLLEFSEIRQSVHTDDDIKDVLKAPMNIDALERERAEKLERKTAIQNDLEALCGVEAELADREAELEGTRERVAELERAIDDLREQQEDATEGGDDLTDLREERADLVRRRNDYEESIADLEDAVTRLDERITETETDLEAAREETESHTVEQLHAKRAEIARDIQDVEDRLDVLQSVLTANREMLSSYAGALGQDSTLLADTITCWACGNTTAEADFETTIDRLQELVAADKQRKREHKPRLEAIEADIEAAERANRRVEELEAQKSDLEQQRTNRAESLATKREQLSAVRDELDELDEELAEIEAEQHSDASDLAAEIEQARVDLHTARREVERLEATVTDLDERLAERDRKEARVDELTEEITALTDTIENLETTLRESFNDAMDQLVDVLDYERIDRVWLDGSFDLIVAREVDDMTRQDTVDHLSESEREMVGLVLALSGYIAYDVADIVPVLLIDTLGAFDADRTANLLAYFATEAPLLVAALLPDSAAAVADTDTDHDVIEPGQLAASV